MYRVSLTQQIHNQGHERKNLLLEALYSFCWPVCPSCNLWGFLLSLSTLFLKLVPNMDIYMELVW